MATEEIPSLTELDDLLENSIEQQVHFWQDPNSQTPNVINQDENVTVPDDQLADESTVKNELEARLWMIQEIGGLIENVKELAQYENMLSRFYDSFNELKYQT